jgi:polyhydroxyalkanoate synthesis regulator phasin
MHKAEEAKVELQHKMEEIASNVYKKMHIAHADDVNGLRTEVEELRKQLNLAEARLKQFESGTPNS